MLVASSLPNFQNAGTPRVISEVKKTSPIKPRDSIRPRISSELLVLCATEKRWWPRRVQVRAGQLFVGNASGETTVGNFRLPLRHLSLAAGPLPNSLALYKGQTVVLTLQTASQAAFDLWVKAIAIEIIRQTPLDAVRYLDILTLRECWSRRKTQDCGKDWNFNCTSRNDTSQCNVCTAKEAASVPPPQLPPPPQPPTEPPPQPPIESQPQPPTEPPPQLPSRRPVRAHLSPPKLPELITPQFLLPQLPASQPPSLKPPNEDDMPTLIRPLNEDAPDGHNKPLILQQPPTTPQSRCPRSLNSQETYHVFPNSNLSIWNKQLTSVGSTPNSQGDKENSFEVLLKKCQSAENYVPVREKLLLFETLCKLGRESLGSEDSSKAGFKMGKKAVSMHDLTNLPYASPGVRQICKYFENKTDIADSKKFSSICRTNRRLINSDSQLHNAQKALNFSQYLKVA